MSELGYYEQIEGGRHGTPDPGDPATRAALQEANAALNRSIVERGEGWVPESYQGNPQQGPSNQQTGGPGSLPIIGWTCQNNSGPAFHPYNPNVGHIPDWDQEGNPIAAGAYDQNEAVAAFGYDRENRAPIGGAVLEYSNDEDPNFFPEDQGGTIDLEW